MNQNDFDAYKRAYYVDPQPDQRYEFTGIFNTTLFYEAFDEAAAFFEQVLGKPFYIEGESTLGWRIGEGWLTILRGNSGNPTNVEVMFAMATSAEAEALQQAFITAGAKGPSPSDELMYKPVRYCPFVDPFGVDFLVMAHLDE